MVNKQVWSQSSYKNDLPWITGHLPKYSINRLMSKAALIKINFSLLFTVKRSLKAIKRKSENLSRSWTSSWSENKSKIMKALCYHRSLIQVFGRRVVSITGQNVLSWTSYFFIRKKTFSWWSKKWAKSSPQPLNLNSAHKFLRQVVIHYGIRHPTID